MATDPTLDLLVKELLWFRWQPEPFEARIPRARVLIDYVGGGNLRATSNELERLRRRYANDPDSPISAYFATSGYQTPGENLTQRLKAYAARRHVVERTALRRSDKGAEALALLLREGLRIDRPWAYIIVGQRETVAQVIVDFVLHPDMEYRAPTAYVGESRTELTARFEAEGPSSNIDYHYNYLPPITLDTNVDESTPLAEISISWVPQVTPIWEFVSNMADNRLYARFTLEPHHFVRIEIRWWDEDAANSRDQPLV